jgi:hypothetical protein
MKSQTPITKLQGFGCQVSRLRSVELRRGKQVSGKKKKLKRVGAKRKSRLKRSGSGEH